MTQYSQVVVAAPMTPAKLGAALDGMRAKGAPDHAALIALERPEGLLLRVVW